MPGGTQNLAGHSPGLTVVCVRLQAEGWAGSFLAILTILNCPLIPFCPTGALRLWLLLDLDLQGRLSFLMATYNGQMRQMSYVPSSCPHLLGLPGVNPSFHI